MTIGRDPRNEWAAQAAEEQRRLAEADAANPQQRASWDAGGDDERCDRRTGRFSRVVERIRRALRR